MESELARLRAENATLKLEREILKDVLSANQEGGRQAMLAIIDPPEEKSAAGRRRR
ncbi:hypothetical protein [Xanthomonas medicagonis]|uniref:hypothetical protein n=1 Tax=Xanthomonas medicagonis TaxID=3160841 RepID=UPI0035177EF0